MKKKNFFLAHKQFTFFLILALLIILGAIFAPVVTGGADPLKGSLTEALAAPSRAHIFGTDKMGRDIFTRVIYGARASLSATFGVVALIFLVGTAAGVTAGYFGGWVDGVVMRIADMMLAFPGLVLALAVAGIMGAGSRNAIIAIVLVNWTKYARLARSLVLKIRDRDYVSAAIVTGSKTKHMLFSYMLPNALPTLIITATTDIGGMMLELAALSFLGFGYQAPRAGMGLYAQRRPCLYAVRTLDDDLPGIGHFPGRYGFNMLEIPCGIFLTPRRRRKAGNWTMLPSPMGKTRLWRIFLCIWSLVRSSVWWARAAAGKPA